MRSQARQRGGAATYGAGGRAPPEGVVPLEAHAGGREAVGVRRVHVAGVVVADVGVALVVDDEEDDVRAGRVGVGRRGRGRGRRGRGRRGRRRRREVSIALLLRVREVALGRELGEVRLRAGVAGAAVAGVNIPRSSAHRHQLLLAAGAPAAARRGRRGGTPRVSRRAALLGFARVRAVGLQLGDVGVHAGEARLQFAVLPRVRAHGVDLRVAPGIGRG